MRPHFPRAVTRLPGNVDNLRFLVGWFTLDLLDGGELVENEVLLQRLAGFGDLVASHLGQPRFDLVVGVARFPHFKPFPAEGVFDLSQHEVVGQFPVGGRRNLLEDLLANRLPLPVFHLLLQEVLDVSPQVAVRLA